MGPAPVLSPLSPDGGTTFVASDPLSFLKMLCKLLDKWQREGRHLTNDLIQNELSFDISSLHYAAFLVISKTATYLM